MTCSGAELFSMYVGEGEALLRETFRRARLAAPAIVFFDEADAVATRRYQSILLRLQPMLVLLFLSRFRRAQ
jgi:ATP-dependent 26S proteasome regulatory subunit